MANDITPRNATGLSPQQITALVELVTGSTVTEAAKRAGVDRTTVHRWLASDALFVATLNQAKQEALDAVRARMRLAADVAVSTVWGLITGDDVHPAIRLKAAVTVLGAVGGLGPEEIGPTEVEGVEASWRRARWCLNGVGRLAS
jgi:AcrR family transcriptional regulator